MGAAVLAPVVLIFEPGAMTGLFAIGPEAFGAVAFSAICSTLIGQGGMAWLLQRHPISTVIPLTLAAPAVSRSAEHTSELQSLMRISYAVFCLNKTNNTYINMP